MVRRGEEVAAVMPYAYKIRLGRFRLIEMPPLTPYLGPWLRNSEAKYANRLSEEKDLMTELIEALPPFASFDQGLHPSVTNWLPFYWKGYNQTTRYTYIIDRSNKPERWWSETLENVRTDIRKAQKQVEVIESTDVAKFIELAKSTFKRQNKSLPYNEEVVYRLDNACQQQGTRKILLAVDVQGRAHAGVYLVWDGNTVYNLISGGDPELRNSGATSLLMWNAIEFALSQGKNFDFEGSVVEPIERFFRAFGARQAPCFEISKTDSSFVKMYRTLWKWTHPAR